MHVKKLGAAAIRVSSQGTSAVIDVNGANILFGPFDKCPLHFILVSCTKCQTAS